MFSFSFELSFLEYFIFFIPNSNRNQISVIETFLFRNIFILEIQIFIFLC